MKCLVLLSVLGLCVAVVCGAATSCRAAEEFFARHNVTADADDVPGPACGGQCCGRGREGGVRAALRRRIGARAAVATRPVAELLLSTKRTLQEHLTGLSHQSQNKTAIFFTQMYKGHASRAHAPLSALYEDIRTILRDSSGGEDIGSPAPKDLGASSRKFFRDVFPVVYHNVLKLSNKQFTPEYESCLRDAYDAAQPFGDLPHQFGASLSRSLTGARALLGALGVGARTLGAGERALSAGRDDACAGALLRAGGCALCRGESARPCRNYCLNVARGCVGAQISELDGPWAGYVEGVERLARSTDADATLRALDTRVSEAVMHALASSTLEKKVRQECGPPSTFDSPSVSPHVVGVTSRRDALRAPPPDTELLQFAASLASSKRLFAGIADRLCDEENAWDGNEDCWNGESVGVYIKPLVPSASVSDQRYNPEVTGGAPQDPLVATLGDRLSQARQVLISHTSSAADAPAAEAYMQGDEAGEEGSGSGRSYDDEASYDAEGSGDDGSGDHSMDRVYPGEGVADTEQTKASAAAVPRASLLLSLTILAALAQSLT